MSKKGSNGICPKCGGKVVTLMESESNSSGLKLVKYVSKCKSCNEVNVIEEVSIKKHEQHVEIVLKK
ncbi:MAG: hypothetical protein RMH77_01790 [Sulfolobales archaeon]|nr:hypothetical protein [Sulfolobales archaeon]MCX8185863.1 hypothetical protein [Sulfolobales archaeon]MDW7969120.1 hypothetical protein [Sulfolobales archaeon]